jgi:hypothetical protein
LMSAERFPKSTLAGVTHQIWKKKIIKSLTNTQLLE